MAPIIRPVEPRCRICFSEFEELDFSAVLSFKLELMASVADVTSLVSHQNAFSNDVWLKGALTMRDTDAPQVPPQVPPFAVFEDFLYDGNRPEFQPNPEATLVHLHYQVNPLVPAYYFLSANKSEHALAGLLPIPDGIDLLEIAEWENQVWRDRQAKYPYHDWLIEHGWEKYADCIRQELEVENDSFS